jgi:hypothetical protein
MATREEIKRTILEVAGNPEAGVVFTYADRWADAIVKLDEPEVVEKPKKAAREVKETRVIAPEEVR